MFVSAIDRPPVVIHHISVSFYPCGFASGRVAFSSYQQSSPSSSVIIFPFPSSPFFFLLRPISSICVLISISIAVVYVNPELTESDDWEKPPGSGHIIEMVHIPRHSSEPPQWDLQLLNRRQRRSRMQAEWKDRG